MLTDEQEFKAGDLVWVKQAKFQARIEKMLGPKMAHVKWHAGPYEMGGYIMTSELELEPEGVDAVDMGCGCS